MKKYIRVSEYAKLMGAHRNTVIRWVKQGRVEYIQPERVILVMNPEYDEKDESAKTWVGYARVSSHGQKSSLQRQESAIMSFAVKNGILLSDVKTEIGSGFNEKRKMLNALLSNPDVNIIVEHRDRLSQSNFQLIESALQAQGRKILVINNDEVESDLVRELSEFLVSKCASIYGKRGARKRAILAVEEAGKSADSCD